MTDDPNASPGKILVGANTDGVYSYLTLSVGNRHGLIAGATGGGKTVTLQKLAEGFSNAGTSVFLADVKGDLAGLSQPGEPRQAFVDRALEIGLAYAPDRFPIVFWDLFGEQGHPVRATISEMGPLLLARLLELNDVQEGVLNVAFRVADEQGLLLLDLKDLRAALTYVADNAGRLKTKYGNVAPATVGAIQRQLLVLERPGRGDVLRRAGARHRRFPARRPRRTRRHQYSRRRQADALAAALRHFPALAAVGTVRAAAGGRRSRQAQARLLLRRGASLVRRRAQGAADGDRASGAAHPLQGRRRLFRHAKSAGRAGQRARPARQSRAARAARLHPARPEGGARGGRNIPAKSGLRHGRGDHAARRRRGARVDARRQGRAADRRSRADRAALRARRADHRPRSARRCSPRVRCAANTTRRSIANRLSRCCRNAPRAI